MSLDISKIEKKINFKFKNNLNIIKTFTHKSYDPINNNEKLEFLGDRVLGLVISKKLLEIYPDEKEGILDKKLASLVNKKKCLEVARSISLEKFILVGNPKKNTKINFCIYLFKLWTKRYWQQSKRNLSFKTTFVVCKI